MVNKNVIEYKNLCAFHPGYYIEELVEEYGMLVIYFIIGLAVITLWVQLQKL